MTHTQSVKQSESSHAKRQSQYTTYVNSLVLCLTSSTQGKHTNFYLYSQANLFEKYTCMIIGSYLSEGISLQAAILIINAVDEVLEHYNLLATSQPTDLGQFMWRLIVSHYSLTDMPASTRRAVCLSVPSKTAERTMQSSCRNDSTASRDFIDLTEEGNASLFLH